MFTQIQEKKTQRTPTKPKTTQFLELVYLVKSFSFLLLPPTINFHPSIPEICGSLRLPFAFADYGKISSCSGMSSTWLNMVFLSI